MKGDNEFVASVMAWPTTNQFVKYRRRAREPWRYARVVREVVGSDGQVIRFEGIGESEDPPPDCVRVVESVLFFGFDEIAEGKLVIVPVVSTDEIRGRRFFGGQQAESEQFDVPRCTFCGTPNPYSLGVFRVRGAGEDRFTPCGWHLDLAVTEAAAHLGIPPGEIEVHPIAVLSSVT